MLAVRAEGDALFHVREKNEILEFNEQYILSEWSPYDGVRIRTYLIPCGDLHVRIHKIETDKKLYVAEGGFSIPRWEDNKDKGIECDAQKSCVQTTDDISVVHNLLGYRGGITVLSENTNLHFPRSVMPVLDGIVNEGITLLACAVFAGTNNAYGKEMLAKVPKLQVENNILKLSMDDVKLEVLL